MLGIIEACVAYITPVSFFYVRSIGEHEQHNILNLELALFCLKHRVSIKQLSFVYFLWKKVFAHWYQSDFLFTHSLSILSDNRSKASSKTIPPHSAI